MDAKSFIGSVLAFAYNSLIGNAPSRILRAAYLRVYLARYGTGTGVQMGCRFLNGRKIHLGDRNVINFGCLLDGRRHGIRTGHDVSIGPEATILTLGHDPQSADFADRGGAVTIGDHVWIGYRSIVLPGVTLGVGAVVWAGAIVTKNVEPFTIVAGNPARRVGDRTRDLHYRCHYSPWLL